jgi:hypothetical protein
VLDQLELERTRGTAGTLILLGTSLGCIGIGIPTMAVGIRAQVDATDYDDLGPSAPDPRTVIGMTSMLTGTVMLAMFHWPAGIAQARSNWLANFYTPEQADELIREYNDRTGEELGLSREDILQLDLQTRRPQIQVVPFVAVGWAGLSGRF